MMSFDSVEAIYEKHEVGESGMNVEAMKSSAAKSQMMMQFPSITGTTITSSLLQHTWAMILSWILMLHHKRNYPFLRIN